MIKLLTNVNVKLRAVEVKGALKYIAFFKLLRFPLNYVHLREITPSGYQMQNLLSASNS